MCGPRQYWILDKPVWWSVLVIYLTEFGINWKVSLRACLCEIILIELSEVGRPIHCGCHKFHGCLLRLYKMAQERGAYYLVCYLSPEQLHQVPTASISLPLGAVP